MATYRVTVILTNDEPKADPADIENLFNSVIDWQEHDLDILDVDIDVEYGDQFMPVCQHCGSADGMQMKGDSWFCYDCEEPHYD